MCDHRDQDTCIFQPIHDVSQFVRLKSNVNTVQKHHAVFGRGPRFSRTAAAQALGSRVPSMCCGWKKKTSGRPSLEKLLFCFREKKRINTTAATEALLSAMPHRARLALPLLFWQPEAR